MADDELKHLGQQSQEPIEDLDRIPWDGGEIKVLLECTEFTSLCPVTRQPDFGTLDIEYIPRHYLVETKSLKLWLWRYRNRPVFNERLVAEIAAEFARQIQPKWARVVGEFHTRGGIAVTAEAHYDEVALRVSGQVMPVEGC